MSKKKSSTFARAFRFVVLLFVSLAFVGHEAWAASSTNPVSPAQAQLKLSEDLQAALAAPTLPPTNWVLETPRGRLVKVIVLGYPTDDPSLKPLRTAIVNAGGSVYYRFVSVTGVLAMLPASQVVEIARRADVERMTPNRATARTASFVDSVTGAVEAQQLSAAPGYDGSGVGIAFLDSGVMASHRAFLDASGRSRVKRSVDMRALGTLLGTTLWSVGVDYGDALAPGSSGRKYLENTIEAASALFQDPYGHGTFVASIAAGRSVSPTLDSSGVAPGAPIYDVRVLGSTGTGEMSDVLEGLDWVLYHAKDYNIRVVNLSLAADSTESYTVDPLCRAVRNTVGAGIAVVVAAGNFGQGAKGETYGTISSPGTEPSAITVGSSNPRATVTRADDTVNNFSSRGPTRGGRLDASGQWVADNLLKPDLVAPGNDMLGAMSTDSLGRTLNAIATTFPSLQVSLGATGTGLMNLSGTSIAAPVVSGTLALMLQANPGLTPPLAKAILQYTAQPLPGANLLQDGAGLVNAAGAVQVATRLMPNIASLIDTGNKLKAGDSLLAPGKSLPAPYSTIGGAVVPWSQFAFVGGNRVVGGAAFVTRHQGIFDPKVSWVRQATSSLEIDDFKSSTAISGFQQVDLSTQKGFPLLSPGVLDITATLGSASLLRQTGLFTLSVAASTDVSARSGTTLVQGVIDSSGIVISEGVTLSEGITLAEGVVIAEGLTLSEGITVSEGIVISESGPLQTDSGTVILLGEP